MKKFPQKTITRSFLYIRTLDRLVQSGQKFVSSRQLADITGLTDVQIRQDISNFGKVGRPRVGYKTTELKKILEDFVLQHTVHVALFGVGNLGAAVLKYPGFKQDKVKIVAGFEKDGRKIGKTINDVKIFNIDDASKIMATMHTEIGIIAVPEDSAQAVADIIVVSGLKGIINFSPVTISVPKKVKVRNIDLSIEFLSLFCEIGL